MKCIAWYDYALFIAVCALWLWVFIEALYRMRTYKPFCQLCGADIEPSKEGGDGE